MTLVPQQKQRLTGAGAQIDFRLHIGAAQHSFSKQGQAMPSVLYSFLLPVSEKGEGETYYFDAVYWVFCTKKNNFMMNFLKGEEKKCRGSFKSSVNGRQIFDMLPKPSALG